MSAEVERGGAPVTSPGDSGGHLAGKLAYGAAFVVVLPALLYGWALGTAREMPFASFRSMPLGAVLVALGLALVVSGMWALRVMGGGLPMNAFPPPRFVRGGVYALVPHPIYVGFCGVVLGLSVYSGSASGLWLVTPITIGGCVALVLGYERHDLLRRFGASHPPTWLHLAPDEGTPPTFAERASVHVLVLWPWLFLYEAVVRLGAPPDAITPYLPGEAHWPVLQGSEVIYLSTYAGIVLATLVAPTRAVLRRFALRGLMAIALVFPLYLTFPFTAPPRPFVPTSWLGEVLAFEHRMDGDGCALPSFHVVWAALAASVFTSAWPRARVAAWAWFALVAASCVTTGMHVVLDVVAGAVAALAVMNAPSIWEWLRRGAERIANSWHEWRLGPVRVINHGVYVGVGTAVGAGILGGLAGPRSTAAIVVTCMCALVVSALWAQIVEGSSQLLRPYGFYGGVLGIIVGSMLSPLVGTPTWVVLAATSVGGPWVQALGRLRCLVQGCCHGSPASPAVGIRYTHPRSRVRKLAHLDGVPLHPTPLYSILWNVVIAMAMARLWSLHAPLRFIGGLYLVLTGLGRFVEESYRGEPQTKIWAGLRLYQWIAVGTVLIGAAVTVFGGRGYAPEAELSWPPMLAALGMGLASFVGMGVDFPSSNRRFSRLV